MGRHKRGFNTEARKVVRGKFVDEDQVRKLGREALGQDGGQPQYGSGGGENDSNVLVLPAKKRNFKREKEANKGKKMLSR